FGVVVGAALRGRPCAETQCGDTGAATEGRPYNETLVVRAIVVLDMLPARRVFRRELLICVGVALILGCVAFFFGLRWLESLMTFRPERMTARERKSPPPGAEIVWFNSADGTHLNGWFFESQSRPAIATIIFFHGNGGNITNVGWMGQ